VVAQLVVGILGWLAGPRELAVAGCTCRAWQAASLEQAIWRRLYFVPTHPPVAAAGAFLSDDSPCVQAAKREKKLENFRAEYNGALSLPATNGAAAPQSTDVRNLPNTTITYL
jgi:hypothetical protein